MDNFKIIYRILKILENSMDNEQFDDQLITNKALDISDTRWARIMKMMIDNGYIEGVRNIEYDGATMPMIRMINPTITLAGLEYLEENSLMKKASNLAKGISGMI